MRFIICLLMMFIIKTIGISQSYSDEFRNNLLSKNYQQAFDLLKVEYNDVMDTDSENMVRISKLYRCYIQFEKACECRGEDDENCIVKGALGLASFNFICNLLYTRGYLKFSEKDFYGAISDFESLINRLDETNDFHFDVLGESYLTIGSSYILLDNLQKGCLSYTKAREFGNERSLELISEYCN
jgi:tetratricopeptide (TPR) repeat protein